MARIVGEWQGEAIYDVDEDENHAMTPEERPMSDVTTDEQRFQWSALYVVVDMTGLPQACSLHWFKPSARQRFLMDKFPSRKIRWDDDTLWKPFEEQGYRLVQAGLVWGDGAIAELEKLKQLDYFGRPSPDTPAQPREGE